MAPWNILYKGDRAQRVFEPMKVEPHDLLQIHSRCSQQSCPEDHVHYALPNGKPCMDNAARVRMRGERTKISRILYMWFVDELSDEERLFRTCDDPYCVNPHHYSRHRSESHATKMRKLNAGERHELFINPEHRDLPFDRCLIE